jgi:hypothetical protein
MTLRNVLLALAAVAGSASAQVRTRIAVDSVIVVDEGGRVAISQKRGDLTINTWTEPRVRVQLMIPGGDSLKFVRRGGTVEIARVASETSDTAHMIVWVPRRVTVEANTRDGVIDVSNTEGSVLIRSAQGDVRGTGLRGVTTINASSGDISVASVTGALSLTTSGGNVTVVGASGDVEALSNAGTVQLRDVCSSRVNARTLRGDVVVAGNALSVTDYTLNSHSGSVVVSVAAQPDVTVQARTVTGNFRTNVEGRLVTREQGQDLVIGKGTGTIRATTFSGPIRVEHVALPAGKCKE